MIIKGYNNKYKSMWSLKGIFYIFLLVKFPVNIFWENTQIIK